MATALVLLSAEHPTLPLAELQAVVAAQAPQSAVQLLCPGVAEVAPSPAPRVLDGLALAHQWGTAWGRADDVEGLVDIVARHADGRGSAAVRAGARGGRSKADVPVANRMLGKALVDAGHTIDLTAPDRTIFAWLTPDGCFVGERGGLPDRGRFEARISERRAHFSPVTLHPRRAASLIHLARPPPGGRVYDPFCGTGTFVVEAALAGFDAWGSDLDAIMVQGSMQALADDGPEPLDGVVFEADIGEIAELMDGVDAIVADMPYGRASSTQKEPVAAVYARAIEACAALLAPGARAVLGMADPSLLDPGPHFVVAEHHEEYVHRSMTRHYVVLERLP